MLCSTFPIVNDNSRGLEVGKKAFIDNLIQKGTLGYFNISAACWYQPRRRPILFSIYLKIDLSPAMTTLSEGANKGISQTISRRRASHLHCSVWKGIRFFGAFAGVVPFPHPIHSNAIQNPTFPSSNRGIHYKLNESPDVFLYGYGFLPL
jgi:hypothetical protein